MSMTHEPVTARMTAEEVVASQRARMLRAVIEAAAEKGYKATTVSDVVGRARVSRKTFYEQFDGLEECFLEAYQSAIEPMRGALVGALGEKREPRERVRALLEVYLKQLAAEPEVAKTYLVEGYSAGPRAAARRRAGQQEFAGLIKALHAEMGSGPELGELDYELIVGAIVNAATVRAATGETAALPELLDELEAFVLRALGAV